MNSVRVKGEHLGKVNDLVCVCVCVFVSVCVCVCGTSVPVTIVNCVKR